MALLLSLFTFLTVTAVLFLIWLAGGSDPNQEVVRRRMEAVRKAERRGEVSLGLKLARDEMLSNVPVFHRLLMQWSWSRRLQNLLSQAGMKTKPGRIILVSGLLALTTSLVTRFFFPRLLVGLIAALAAGLTPIGLVVWKRRTRLRKFEENFPQALDLLGRAVRAGHAFTTGLEMIAKESSEPLAGEFRATFEEQNFGLPLRDALLNMADRVPLIDVRFFVTSLLIQKETGGNLAEILDGLAKVIRDRFRIYRDVKVRTAQGRLTAGILIALPPFMMAVLGFLNPHYIGILFTDRVGPELLAVAATLQFIGSAIIWKIIHFEV
jgi:tight adherence protein B